MDIFEAIQNRKSVRSYLDRAVEPEKPKAIAEAGNRAAGSPTAGRRHFTVVTNRGLICQISADTKAALAQSPMERARQLAANPHYDPVFGAPAMIIISIEEQLSPIMEEVALQNAAAAGENILLAATALGLGSCYTGGIALTDETRAALHLPEGLRPLCKILIGYAADSTPHAPRPEHPENLLYVG